MNILLVTGPNITLREPYSSGIESFVVSLAEQLIKDGNSVDIVAEDASDNTPFGLINPFVGTSTTESSEKALKRNQSEQFAAMDISKYDVIHYNMYYPHLFKAGEAFGKPSLLTLHTPATRKRVRTYKRFLKNYDAKLIAISERMRDQWQKLLKRPISVIQNGIDLEKWPVKNTQGEYLFWSARINKEKNPGAAISLAKHVGAPLKIAGRITDQKYFDTHVKPYLSTNIQYVEHVTQREVSKLARKASAFLVTAKWQEPFGLASLEMLASGVPVIGFERAVPATWKHKSVSTVSSANWKDLIEPLKRSKNVTPDNSREFASKMSLEVMSQQYTKLYHKMIDKSQYVTEQSKLSTFEAFIKVIPAIFRKVRSQKPYSRTVS